MWVASSFVSITVLYYDVRELIKNSALPNNHNSIVVLGDKLAKDGIRPAIDILLRDHEMHLSYILITKGEAADIIKAPSELEKIPGKQLESMIRDYGQASKTVASSIQDIYDSLLSESTHPVLGRVQLQAGEENTDFILEGAGVFQQDKLIGWLGPLIKPELREGKLRYLIEVKVESNQVEVEISVNSKIKRTGHSK